MPRRSLPNAPVVVDQAQSKFNASVVDALRQNAKTALVGRDIELTALTAGTNNVAHGLGKIPTGWIVIRKNATADLWEAQDPNDKYLFLATDNVACEFVIRVF